MSNVFAWLSHRATVSLTVCVTLLGLVGRVSSVELARDGQTQYVIVTAAHATPAEQFAAKELQAHLKQITGAEFESIVETASAQPEHAVYIGWTDFAREQSIEMASLGDQEWIIRTVGSHLVLCGGRPQGTLYAVYEFLEAQLGCHWLDESTQIIPSHPTLTLKPLNIRGKPAFWDRHIYTGTSDSTEGLTLRARNKDTRGTRPEFGFGMGLGGHSFYSYAKEFPTNHPEYLALDRAGNRPVSTSGSGPGQICLTHPEARKLMLQRLRRLITEDRAAVAAVADTGRKPTRVYFVEANDTHWICQCPTCQDLSEREASDSGPMIDLVNYMADGIRDEFPDVLIDTFAYSNTLKPPKTIRPRDNVIIRLAQLNAEWSTDAIGKKNWTPEQYPDMFRPMTHPVNREADALLTGWSKITKQLAYWDYWVKYSDKYPIPSVNVSTLQPDLKRFLDHGVGMMFTECEQYDTSSFFALKRWLGWKLMQNPDQDPAPLIRIFMDGFYGPAADPMAEYLNYLEARIAAVPTEIGKLSALKAHDWPYFDRDFYETCARLFDDAEALCGTNTAALVKIYRERRPVDSSLYCLWERVADRLAPGQTMPWTQDSVLRRYEANRRAELAFQKQTSEKHEEALELELEKMRGFGSGARRAEKPPVLSVPDLADASAAGNPDLVDWSKAAPIKSWSTLYGSKRPERKVQGAVIHDTDYLYLALEEAAIDPMSLSTTWWGGDGWEIFVAAPREGRPYRQLAINAEGKHQGFRYDNGQQNWASGAVVTTQTTGECWRVCLSIPLKNLTEDGTNAVDRLFVNIFRVTPSPGVTLCWSPIYEQGFHDMAQLVELVLKKTDD